MNIREEEERKKARKLAALDVLFPHPPSFSAFYVM
jgi:hypothetical protein